MVLISRALSGLAVGLSVAVAFTYFGVSYEKYVEDLKALDRFDEKRVVRTKGFVFSLFNIGNTLGFGVGGGKLGKRKMERSGRAGEREGGGGGGGGGGGTTTYAC